MSFFLKHSKSNVRFWTGRCDPSTKGWTIILLALAFVTQTAFVYTDSSQTTPFEGQALDGRRIWFTNNCQACHQLYGFGGFLGPDLTNAASRIKQNQLEERLSMGKGLMPRFDLSQDEMDSLWAFLEEMDLTGIGQARNPSLNAVHQTDDATTSPREITLGQIIDESGNKLVSEGFDIYKSGTCTACHVLFGKSMFGAPDLTLTGSRLESSEILQILEHGKPPLMPPSGLSPDQRVSVEAFISFMSEHRDETVDRVDNESWISFWLSVPWWEFE